MKNISNEGSNQNAMSHLKELRRRFIAVLIFFLVCFLIAFIFVPTIMDFIRMTSASVSLDLNLFNVTDALSIYMKIASLSAFVCTMPFILFQTWRFIKPGLMKHEIKYVRRLLPIVFILFLVGVAFSYFVIIPYSTFISAITFNFPSVYENLKWYILLFGSLALVLLTGKNLYCTYICPFGAMQQLEFKLAKLDFFKVNPRIIKYAAQLPGVIAYIAFILAMFTGNVSATSYEPFSLVFGRVGVGIQWV